MHFPEWLVTPYMKIDNKAHISDLEDGHHEMHVHLEAEAFFKSNNL